MHINHSTGFILLEVLVAMSLISGVWVSSIGIYQVLVLRLIQQERKQVLLRKTFDDYEIAEHMRISGNEEVQQRNWKGKQKRNQQANQANPANVSSILDQGLKHDPSRVSRWNDSLRSTTKSTSTN